MFVLLACSLSKGIFNAPAKEGSQPWNALMLINMTVFTAMPLR